MMPAGAGDRVEPGGLPPPSPARARRPVRGRDAPLHGLEVEGAAGGHVLGGVRDVHPHAPAAAREGLDGHGVVDVQRRDVVDGER